VAIGLAPLLLLRTDESTRLGLKWFGGFWERFSSGSDLVTVVVRGVVRGVVIAGVVTGVGVLIILAILVALGILGEVLAFTIGLGVGWVIGVLLIGIVVGMVGMVGIGGVVGVVSLIIKFTATTFTFFRHPLSSLQAIPANWYRIVLATDMWHPPELLPGIESQRYRELIDGFHDLRFREWLRRASNGDDIFSNILSWILGWILTLIFFLPALLYRWSLKSSALFYLPFIWIIGTPTHIKKLHENLDEQLALWKDSALAKVGVIYAVIVIVFFTALPLFLKIKLHDLSAGLPANLHGLTEMIVPFFVTFEWKAWHVARFLAAVITLGVWFYLDTLVIQRKFRKDVGLHGEAKIIFHLLRVRQLLSLFTLACGVYVLYQMIPWAEIFHNFQWVPWR